MISKTLARKYMAKQRELEAQLVTDKAQLVTENIKLKDRVKALEIENAELISKVATAETEITELKEDVSKLTTTKETK